MTIAVDFDGTIAQMRFPEVGLEVPGAFHWLKQFQAAGARLILWTVRGPGAGTTFEGFPVQGNALEAAVQFCREHGLEFWQVNCNPESQWLQSPKVHADLFIDDMAFGCPLIRPLDGGPPHVDWSVVGPAVLHRLRLAKARVS